MSPLEFDASVGEQLEIMYRTRDVRRRRELVTQALGVTPGERVLDAGCGPGFYVSELLDAVGSDGSVTGVDGSPEMLAVAAHRCEAHDNVAFHQSDVTSLPVQDAAFDAALSVQVLEYVPDATAALAEMHRALRPGGRVVVWDVDWATVSMYSADPARMARVLRAWDGHLTHRSLPQTLATRLRSAGFQDVGMQAHVFATTELTPESYGGAALPVLERYLAGQDEVPVDEVEAWAADQRDLGARGEFFFSCTQFCFTATRPA
ncbi:MAG: methyltransferase domain-containing protein [Solirubrobacterales bacterium]|nr:methyltransferase domain-containing protein [Solirubrobacterales bacterium]